jgi:serine/threonine protein kinase
VESFAANDIVGKTVAGRFAIEGLLGTGGTASVYKALDTTMQRHVAVKVLHNGASASAIVVKRLSREVQILASLSHPNILTIHALHLVPEVGYCTITDLVEGETLAHRLERGGKLALDEFKLVFEQVCAGLAFAHSKGVIHRDIKPSNIMLTKDTQGNPQARILDFGLSKSMDAATLQQLTQTGEIFGSANYMSPEQCSGGSLDQRSDVYSLGCTMYECLSGDVPFVADNLIATLYKHSLGPLPQLADSALSAVSSVLQKCTSVNPDHRFSSVDEVWNAIESGQPISVRGSTGKPPAGIPPLLWKTAVLGLAVAAGTAWIGWRSTHSRRLNEGTATGADSQANVDELDDHIKDDIVHHAERLRSDVEYAEKQLEKGYIPVVNHHVQFTLALAYAQLAKNGTVREQVDADLQREIDHCTVSMDLLYKMRRKKDWDVLNRCIGLRDDIAQVRPHEPKYLEQLAEIMSRISRADDDNALFAHLIRARACNIENNSNRALEECKIVFARLPERLKSQLTQEDLRLTIEAITTALDSQPDHETCRAAVDLAKLALLTCQGRGSEAAGLYAVLRRAELAAQEPVR